MDLSQAIKGLENGANLDLNVLKEPRGVTRVLQFVISIFAALALYGFEGIVNVKYCNGKETLQFHYSYPFKLSEVSEEAVCNKTNIALKLADDNGFSQYAEFFLYISILSVLYCICLMVIYTKFTQSYETDNRFPLGDFIGTVLISVFWLFGSAAWSHGLSGLKAYTSRHYVFTTLNNLDKLDKLGILESGISVSSYFGLNVSAILGCLSFFLWASDLWFLYKETPWFQGRHSEAVGNPA